MITKPTMTSKLSQLMEKVEYQRSITQAALDDWKTADVADADNYVGHKVMVHLTLSEFRVFFDELVAFLKKHKVEIMKGPSRTEALTILNKGYDLFEFVKVLVPMKTEQERRHQGTAK